MEVLKAYRRRVSKKRKIEKIELKSRSVINIFASLR
jgi:hypothetical protein